MTHPLESPRTSSPHVTLLGVLALGAVLLAGCGGDECAGCDGPQPQPTPSGSCVDDAPPATAPAIVPGLVFGNGVGFSELTEGGVIELQFGGQGGSHVDLSARTYVDGGQGFALEFAVDGAGWGESTMVSLSSCDGQWSQTSGRVFDPPSGDVTLSVRVLDADQAELATTAMPAYIE